MFYVHPDIYTVVSAYIPLGYKPTSASVLLKEFPDCFCYPLHSKVSLFSPTGYKHKPASVLRNFPLKHAKKSVCKPTAENHLLKLVSRMQRAADQSLSTPHREVPELCLACITSYNTTYAGRCSERPPVTLRNYMICG